MAQFNIARYLPPGPVAAAFINDASPLALLLGPVGSGKTHGCIFKALRFTAMMPPCADGIIRAKGAVVRDSYRTLYATTLSSWFMWFPKDYPGGRFIGGDDRPAFHTLNFTTPRGRKIELTMEFKALGEHRVEDVMRGWEGTFGWVNEADLVDVAVPRFLAQRVGRWPSKAMLGGQDCPAQVFGDLNAPDEDHWIAKLVDQPVEGWNLHMQPSGLSPEAENVQNLPKGYYDRVGMGQPRWYVDRFVHAKFGYGRDGTPVYPEFDVRRHVASAPLKPVKELPLKLGLDAGLHPAAVISQDMPNGQHRVLEEVYLGRAGPGRFGEKLRNVLLERYQGFEISVLAHDPSALYGADTEHGEMSWVDTVAAALRDFEAVMMPAPSNEPTIRTEAVRNVLVFNIEAEIPGLLVDPRCKILIKGFASKYQYKIGPDGKLPDPDKQRPEKNEFSNVHDALQYEVLTSRGRVGVVNRAAKGTQGGKRSLGGGATVLKSEFAV